MHGRAEGRISAHVDHVEGGRLWVEESAYDVDGEWKTCNGACVGLYAIFLFLMFLRTVNFPSRSRRDTLSGGDHCGDIPRLCIA